MAIRLGGTVGGVNYVGSTHWEPMANVPRIDSIDADGVVVDGQLAFPVVVANFSTVDKITVTAGGQSQEWSVAGFDVSTASVAEAIRGNLPYGPQYTHTMTVEDTVAGESATRTFSFLPPAGYEAGPVIPSTFLTTPDSIGSAFVGAVDEGDQLKLPNTYTSGGTPYAITWELDGSGNYTGRIASIDGPADQTLQGELWRLNGTPKWLQFSIDMDSTTPVTGYIDAQEAGQDTASVAGTLTISGIVGAVESGKDSAAFDVIIADPVVVSGHMSAVESGKDTASAAVMAFVSGTAQATETGKDTAAAAGYSLILGAMTVQEAGEDIFAATGDSDGPAEIIPVEPFNLGGPTTNALPGLTYSSDEVVIVGGLPGASLSVIIAGGTYSIDGAAPTSAPGTMQAGQTIQVFVVAPVYPYDTAEAVLTIAGVSSSYIVVTGEGQAGGFGVQFFVKDRVTGDLITDTTIDLRIDSQQFGGWLIQEFDDLPIDSSGFLVVPMNRGEIGRQVFVSGELADGKQIAGTTGIMALP